jgi:hypothetical protein
MTIFAISLLLLVFGLSWTAAAIAVGPYRYYCERRRKSSLPALSPAGSLYGSPDEFGRPAGM